MTPPEERLCCKLRTRGDKRAAAVGLHHFACVNATQLSATVPLYPTQSPSAALLHGSLIADISKSTSSWSSDFDGVELLDPAQEADINAPLDLLPLHRSYFAVAQPKFLHPLIDSWRGKECTSRECREVYWSCPAITSTTDKGEEFRDVCSISMVDYEMAFSEVSVSLPISYLPRACTDTQDWKYARSG